MQSSHINISKAKVPMNSAPTQVGAKHSASQREEKPATQTRQEQDQNTKAVDEKVPVLAGIRPSLKSRISAPGSQQHKETTNAGGRGRGRGRGDHRKTQEAPPPPSIDSAAAKRRGTDAKHSMVQSISVQKTAKPSKNETQSTLVNLKRPKTIEEIRREKRMKMTGTTNNTNTEKKKEPQSNASIATRSPSLVDGGSKKQTIKAAQKPVKKVEKSVQPKSKDQSTPKKQIASTKPPQRKAASMKDAPQQATKAATRSSGKKEQQNKDNQQKKEEQKEDKNVSDALDEVEVCAQNVHQVYEFHHLTLPSVDQLQEHKLVEPGKEVDEIDDEIDSDDDFEAKMKALEENL